ncbi:MAG: hypothetical protein P4L91_05640 [Burkholderiaceae bacterium]|nr:hypothetical protein [Burkholderiaceae bacterium]
MYLLPNSASVGGISVSVGDLNLVESGVIHVPPDQQISMTIGVLRYRWQFLFDAGETRLDAVDEAGTLLIRLFNHGNPLGSGLLVPFEIASYTDGARLYLTYFASRPTGQSGFRVEYCLFKSIPVGTGIIGGAMASALL